MKIPYISKSDNKNKASSLKFDQDDIKDYSIYTNLLRKELYNVNTYITRLIMHYKKKPSYIYSIVDLRVMYEELINFILTKFLIYANETKELNTKDNINQYVDSSRENNEVMIYLKTDMTYNLDMLKQFTNYDVFEDINNSVLKISVLLGNIADIEAKVYVKSEGVNKEKANVNDYKMLYNDQLYKFIGNYVMICNLCKNEFIKTAVNNANEKLNKS